MTSRFDRKKVKLRKDEAGYALALVLILLILVGLIIGPLLLLMTTSLMSSYRHQGWMLEFYAADAGIEDALWKLIYAPPASYPYGPYQLDVNDNEVNVTIEDMGSQTYKITSTAGSATTTIESYVAMAGLLDGAITSLTQVNIGSNCSITGNVLLPDEDDLGLGQNTTMDGEVIEADVSAIWPDADEVSAYYLSQVNVNDDAYPSDTIDIADTTSISALYRDGDLHIDNTGDPETLVLNGTVYVTGNLSFDQPGANKEYTIALNGQTIYADGSITFPPHFVTISGSGCIIARGDIDFWPDISSVPGDFVFVMSIDGEVDFSPQADFSGALAGNVNVNLQSGCDLTWGGSSGAGLLDFPFGEGLAAILTYTIVD